MNLADILKDSNYKLSQAIAERENTELVSRDSIFALLERKV
jgi:hypothetical protein